MPPGITATKNNNSIVLSGKPTKADTYEFDVYASDTNGTVLQRYRITIRDAIALSIALSPNEVTLKENDKKKLTVSFTPHETADKTVTYQTNNPSVATVDNQGNVTASAPGIASIIATAKSGAQAVSVITVQKTYLDRTSGTLVKGETTTLNAQVQPTNHTDQNVTWKSSNTNIATVDSNGKVTAKAKGEANITATSTAGSIATFALTVTEPVTGIRLDKTSLSFKMGEEPSTAQLTATRAN